jgi:hypothetical protein
MSIAQNSQVFGPDATRCHTGRAGSRAALSRRSWSAPSATSAAAPHRSAAATCRSGSSVNRCPAAYRTVDAAAAGSARRGPSETPHTGPRAAPRGSARTSPQRPTPPRPRTGRRGAARRRGARRGPLPAGRSRSDQKPRRSRCTPRRHGRSRPGDGQRQPAATPGTGFTGCPAAGWRAAARRRDRREDVTGPRTPLVGQEPDDLRRREPRHLERDLRLTQPREHRTQLHERIARGDRGGERRIRPPRLQPPQLVRRLRSAHRGASPPAARPERGKPPGHDSRPAPPR